MSLILRLRNEIDFYLRQLFRWQRSGYHAKPDPTVDIFHHLQGNERFKAQRLAARLEDQYQFGKLREKTSPGNYRENLFYLSMLEQIFDHFHLSLPDSCSAVDVGVSHWFYARSLIHFLRYYHAASARSIELDGFEIDAFRVYSDFHSRFDHALANIEGEESVKYHPEAFSEKTNRYDLGFQFFPFIFIQDHREWGVPDRLFDPTNLLMQLSASIKKDGMIVIVNQGSEESARQKVMMEEIGLSVSGPLEIDPLLFQYDYKRYVLVGKRS